MVGSGDHVDWLTVDIADDIVDKEQGNAEKVDDMKSDELLKMSSGRRRSCGAVIGRGNGASYIEASVRSTAAGRGKILRDGRRWLRFDLDRKSCFARASAVPLRPEHFEQPSHGFPRLWHGRADGLKFKTDT